MCKGTWIHYLTGPTGKKSARSSDFFQLFMLDMVHKIVFWYGEPLFFPKNWFLFFLVDFTQWFHKKVVGTVTSPDFSSSYRDRRTLVQRSLKVHSRAVILRPNLGVQVDYDCVILSPTSEVWYKIALSVYWIRQQIWD